MAQVDFQASLVTFQDRALITDEAQVIKSGKEATVYRCRAGASTKAEFLAAKIYRPLMSRSFRNDAVYQEGRVITDARLRRAYEKKSSRGRSVQFGMWVSYEYETLEALHYVGADVPRPYAYSDSTILMEYIGDESSSAPLLRNVSLPLAEAKVLFHLIMWNVELFLRCNRVHADLSEFNILYWRHGIKIIDFPQSVDPRVNRSAFMLLVRDLERVCSHFARYGINEDPVQRATELWGRFLRAEL